MGYNAFLVQHAAGVVVLVVLVILAMGVITLFLAPVPSFEVPTEGFQARGTKLKGRSSSLWKFFSSNSTVPPGSSYGKTTHQMKMPASVPANMSSSMDFKKTLLTVNMAADITQIQEGCSILTADVPVQIVFESRTLDGNLMTAEALRELCGIEAQLTAESTLLDSTCQSHSISSYIGQILNKNCSLLDESDVKSSVQLLRKCSKYYHEDLLSPLCVTYGCPLVPPECLLHGAVFDILHFLSDEDFMDADNHSSQLTYASIIVRLADEDKKKQFYYNEVQNKFHDSKTIRVAGIDAKLKFDLFNEYLIWDLLYFILAMSFIVVIVCLYLRSFVLTIATILDVAFSFGIAYFLYFIVFRFVFFPFLNLLSGLVIIALVADDVFLYYDTFQRMKLNHPEKDAVEWTTETMRHAGLSIFVTSLTTASAFLANIVSEITAIRCFGIFSATAILSNFVLMITWIPAIIILVEKGKDNCAKSSATCAKWQNHLVECCSNASKAIFHRLLPAVINNVYLVWIFLLFIFGTIGAIVIFIEPKLTLPTTEVVQIFSKNDPLEVYDHELKFKFRFMQDAYQTGLMVHAVWGLDDQDNGNHLDPQSNGSLVFDHSFDLSSPQSQQWLATFCHHLQNATFITEDLPTSCTLDLFNEFMMSNCTEHSIPGCCSHISAPFPSDLFQQCFPTFIKTVKQQNSLGSPFFDSGGNKTKVFILSFRSTQVFKASYKEMHAFYQTLETFMEEQLLTAPPGVRNGWCISNFEFYDIQRALSSGSYSAIGISLTVVLGVMFFTSRNAVITFYAIITISLAIFVTEGVLVLLGWELNVLESIIVSLAVGLSIDFAIHYGVAYRLSHKETRHQRVTDSFCTVGSPVAMAAFTTFLAGAAMMPARINGYRQLGIFLMVVMACSWAYATFFFQSLCRLAGPVGNFSQIPNPFTCCKKKSPEDDSVTRDIEINKLKKQAFQRTVERSLHRTSLRLARGRDTKLDVNSYMDDEKSASPMIMMKMNGNAASSANSVDIHGLKPAEKKVELQDTMLPPDEYKHYVSCGVECAHSSREESPSHTPDNSKCTG